MALTTCPKSYVTGESEALVEEFAVRRRIGGTRLEDLSARQAEAFVVLEEAIEQQRIPKAARDMAKGYFQKMREQADTQR